MGMKPDCISYHFELNGILKKYCQKFERFSYTGAAEGRDRLKAIREAESHYMQSTEKLRKRAILLLTKIDEKHEKLKGKKHDEKEARKNAQRFRRVESRANIYNTPKLKGF